MNESFETKKCLKGCCTYRIAPFHDETPGVYKNEIRDITGQYKKGGCFIVDRAKNKILLVQSNAKLWGPPKGGVNKDETIKKTAIREVKEETGLDVDEGELTQEIVIHSENMYYVVDRVETDIYPQVNNTLNDDANGIGFFHIDCLKELINSKDISLNMHCKRLISNVLKVHV